MKYVILKFTKICNFGKEYTPHNNGRSIVRKKTKIHAPVAVVYIADP
jgi:hypothetical protein